MKRAILAVVCMFVSFMLFAQPTTTLTFTAQKADYEWLKLDSVVIRNFDRNWEETIVWPDTLLILTHTTNIDDFSKHDFRFFQTGSNPFNSKTTVSLSLPEAEKVTLRLTNLHGKVILEWSNFVNAGIHQFQVSISDPQIHILSCYTSKNRSSIKLVNTAKENSGSKIEYLGSSNMQHHYTLSNTKGVSTNIFYPGDEMKYTAFAVQERVSYNVSIIQNQYVSDTILFTFPKVDLKTCLQIPYVLDFEGNIYTTVQIGKQCWLRENLKSRFYADGEPLVLGDTIHDHDLPFYYRYQHSDSIAEIYGLLYTWAAAMRGNTPATDSAHVQGVCPDGWHVPTDEEWCDMEFVLAPESSCDDPVPYYGISNFLARQLSAPRLWASDNATQPNMPGYWSIDSLNYNTSEFSAIPAGQYEHGAFFGLHWGAMFWTATEDENSDLDAIRRYIYSNNRGVNRVKKEKCHGFSIRCVYDELME